MGAGLGRVRAEGVLVEDRPVAGLVVAVILGCDRAGHPAGGEAVSVRGEHTAIPVSDLVEAVIGVEVVLVVATSGLEILAPLAVARLGVAVPGILEDFGVEPAVLDDAPEAVEPGVFVAGVPGATILVGELDAGRVLDADDGAHSKVAVGGLDHLAAPGRASDDLVETAEPVGCGGIVVEQDLLTARVVDSGAPRRVAGRIGVVVFHGWGTANGSRVCLLVLGQLKEVVVGQFHLVDDSVGVIVAGDKLQ